MNGRLYDPVLHRFLQPDNNIQDPLNSQNYNRYGYAWNNPLRYSDPSGEIIWFVVGLAVIGGTINLATNIAQGNITGSFWEKVGKGFAAFGAGAASGALSIYGPVGWAAGGVIMGGTNAWLAGQDPMQGMMIGGLSGLAGGYLGKWMAPAINNIVVNGIQVSSPMLAGAISGSIGGAAIGGAMGGTMSLIQGGSFGDGFAQGFSTGALSGFVSGAGGGYLSAKANNVNPLSGKSNVKPEPPVNPLLEVKTTETNQSIIKTEVSTVSNDLVRVRHHTSSEGLSGIKKSGFINASRGYDFNGVAVEVQPFMDATKVNLGQNGRGSFIEFSVPKSQLVLPSFSIGTGNHGIINNGGAGYNLSGTNPRFVRFNWFDF